MLCIIDSGLSLPRIKEILLEHGEIGPIRVLWKQGRETRKSLVLMSEEVYKNLIDAGFGRKKFNLDLSLATFEFRETHLPGEGKTLNWKILFPEDYRDTLRTPSKVHSVVNKKLDALVKFGVLPHDDCYRIDIPLNSRTTEELAGVCFVSFKKDVDPKAIAMARLICNDSVWDDVFGAPLFNIMWATDRTERKKTDGAEPSAQADRPAATDRRPAPVDRRPVRTDRRRPQV